MTPTDQPPTTDPDDHIVWLPPVAPDAPAVSWYRRGRHYAQCMSRAAAAEAADRHQEADRLHEYADSQLWPLNQATADQLRDFIAGINKELERDLHPLSATS